MTPQELLGHLNKLDMEGPEAGAALERLFMELTIQQDALVGLHDFLNPESKVFEEPEGHTEFGMILYWAAKDPDIVERLIKDYNIPNDEADVLRWVWDLIVKKVSDLKITVTLDAKMLNFLEAKVAPDGTLWGWGKYQQLDLGWLFSALNYAINLLLPFTVSDFRLPAHDKLPGIPIAGKTPTEVTLALLGDWGTGIWKDKQGPAADGGQGPAFGIREDISTRGADYFIHLGDVYYAGTRHRPPSGEEQNFLVDLWWKKFPPEKSFALNSNHEMYGGANGYYKVALDKSGFFPKQGGLSMFMLTFERWIILGLDSAYFSGFFYMKGSLGNKHHQKQIQAIQNLKLGEQNDKKIILLTHHNPMDYTGQKKFEGTLWGDAKAAIGRAPDFWYWGHIHNGIVYNTSLISKTTVGRCTGHAAIPFGAASGLSGLSEIDYFADTAVGGADNPRVLNGFTTLKLEKNSMTETFFEQSTTTPGTPTAKWTKTFAI